MSFHDDANIIDSLEAIMQEVVGNSIELYFSENGSRVAAEAMADEVSTLLGVLAESLDELGLHSSTDLERDEIESSLKEKLSKEDFDKSSKAQIELNRNRYAKSLVKIWLNSVYEASLNAPGVILDKSYLPTAGIDVQELSEAIGVVARRHGMNEVTARVAISLFGSRLRQANVSEFPMGITILRWPGEDDIDIAIPAADEETIPEHIPVDVLFDYAREFDISDNRMVAFIGDEADHNDREWSQSPAYLELPTGIKEFLVYDVANQLLGERDSHDISGVSLRRTHENSRPKIFMEVNTDSLAQSGIVEIGNHIQNSLSKLV